jgi:3-oxoacyl-[acyl-carrier-protein] synthase-1
MKSEHKVFISGDNILTSLGFSTQENIIEILNNKTGICAVKNDALSLVPAAVSVVSDDILETRFQGMQIDRNYTQLTARYTRLERMIILSVHDALMKSGIDPGTNDLLFILSTTKGNIDLLEDKYKLAFNHKRVFLWELARVIGHFFGFRNRPMIISNACISGLMAVITGTRMLKSGHYRHAVIAGADLVSEFVISGFQSFQALSTAPCKPFDQNRTGLSLGEGCGTMILSLDPPADKGIRTEVAGGAVTNDANHISGPSRTGEELALAIRKAMEEAETGPEEVSVISAHGTATPYNDEMESKAIEMAGLSSVPLYSMKGYWGHTLGAAGVIESIVALESLRKQMIFKSAGFNTPGVPGQINVATSHHDAKLSVALKTASGFGGCNAAVIYKTCQPWT